MTADEKRAYKAAWARRRYWSDPEAARAVVREAARRRYAADPGKVNASVRRWKCANKDKVRAGNRRYEASHREEIRARGKRWRARQSPEKGMAKHLRQYGMTRADYESLLARQGGVCAICKSSDPRSGGGVGKQAGTSRKWGTFHVDHDHVSGKVRGLLCLNCNAGIGQLGDSLERVRAAAAYLEAAQ